MSLPIWSDQRGVVGDANDLARIAGKRDVAAAVVAYDLRLDVRSGEIGRGVHVRTEADDRHGLFDVGGKGRVDIAVLIQMRVGEADREQFRDQHAAERFLLLGRGLRRRRRIGLRVDDDIAKEAIDDGIGHEAGPNLCDVL